jgi:hypothetical protein
MADEIWGKPVTHLNGKPTTSGDKDSESNQDSFTDDSVRAHGGLTPGKERNREQGTGNREGICAPQAERETLPASPPGPKPKRAPKPGSDSDPDWLKFWEIYPLKKSKEGARKAWAAALKKAAAAEIIAGAERYRDDRGRKPEFTKHPTTWLNQGCWADELTPVPAGAHQPYQDPDPADYYGDL